MKRFKRLLIGLSIFLLSSIFSLHYFCKNGLEENIESEETQFSKEIGFINWGHANPSNTSKFFDKFQKLNRSATDSFNFSYSQKLTFSSFGTSFVIEQQETRKFTSHLTPLEEKIAFLEIFSSVSESFETMQGSFPLLLFPGSSGSSFRHGDLMGNLMSFYSTCYDVPLVQIKDSLTFISKDEALNRIPSESIQKVDWNYTLKNCDSSHIMVSQLTKLISKLKQPLSTKVSNQRLFYQKN